MPQFDPSSFPSQIFWLAVTFIILYLLMSRIALPRITEVMEERSARIADDLERAETLKKEAEAVIASFEQSLAEARDQASAALAQANAEIADLAAERQRVFAEEMRVKTEDAEARINAAKAEARTHIREIASEVAIEAANRLTGQRIDRQAAERAVDAELERAA